MDRYIALDVHTESTSCAVLSSAGKRLKLEIVETSGFALISFLKTVPGRKHLVLEEGTHSAWLHETVSPFVDEVVVAIPNKTTGNKSDAKDAWSLAEQLRSGAIQRTVFQRPRELAALRAAVRAHRHLTNDIVRVKNRLRALFRSRAIAVTAELYEPAGRKKSLAALPEDSRYQAEVLSTQLDALVPLLDHAEEYARRRRRRYRALPTSRLSRGLVSFARRRWWQRPSLQRGFARRVSFGATRGWRS